MTCLTPGMPCILVPPCGRGRCGLTRPCAIARRAFGPRCLNARMLGTAAREAGARRRAGARFRCQHRGHAGNTLDFGNDFLGSLAEVVPALRRATPVS